MNMGAKKRHWARLACLALFSLIILRLFIVIIFFVAGVLALPHETVLGLKERV
jgi:uncharacterized RDD family membrane protein YckC